ncbi:MAG: hypothetical protein LBV00_10260 [Propionibacteriaceae bacterium]|jgi:UDP-N-acetylmuramoylalanine--D-glutamate ligase|nr:hypothetical protein [Propionibacteriaceae bacterium]
MTSHVRVTPAWSSLRVAVGLGRTTVGVADALIERGASVDVLVDGAGADMTEQERLLTILGAYVSPVSSAQDLVGDWDLLVPAAAWGLDHPAVRTALACSTTVVSDVEVAWRLQHEEAGACPAPPWLLVTGDDDVDATVRMAQAMLVQSGVQACGLSPTGRPVIEAALDDTTYECWVVGVSPAQLHWASSIRTHSAVVLNCGEPGRWYEGADDPVRCHGDDLATVYHQVSHSCVYNVEDSATERMVEEADVVEGARAIGFTTGMPAVSMMGVVDEILVDRAFIPQRRDSAQELAAAADVPGGAAMIAPALAAAALARSFGAPARSVRDGLVAVGSDQTWRSTTDDPEVQADIRPAARRGAPDDNHA